MANTNSCCRQTSTPGGAYEIIEILVRKKLFVE